MALDFFLFYVFWEVMLLPMYFLIGVWGGPRREYAAIKFFLYTLLGSVLMLIAILMLYFNSDLTQLSPEQLATAGIISVGEDATAQQAFDEWLQSEDGLAQEFSAITSDGDAANPRSLHTFNILALQQMGQHTDLFNDEVLFGKSIQWWAFVLLGIGFVIKVPSVPVHTWLPDAHVEAPTPISMILAGILLKMGWLRHHSYLLSHLPTSRIRSGLRGLLYRRTQHGVRCVCRSGPKGLQADGRL